jgi:hypothetical protein
LSLDGPHLPVAGPARNYYLPSGGGLVGRIQ